MVEQGILVTGGSGFVGTVLLQRLARDARWAPRASPHVCRA